jgi:hypothetical protein
VGDFIVRTGALSVGGLQQAAVLVEVEYTPCCNLIAAAPILHEFIENLIVSSSALTSLPPLSSITIPSTTGSITTATATPSPPPSSSSTAATTTTTTSSSSSPPSASTTGGIVAPTSGSSMGVKVAVGQECLTLQQFGLSMHQYSARHTAVQYALVASQKQSTPAGATAAAAAAAAAQRNTTIASSNVGATTSGSVSTLGSTHNVASSTPHSVRIERDLPMT